jgi:hypothetical protein
MVTALQGVRLAGCLLLWLLAAGSLAAAEDRLRAEVDRDRLSLDETFELLLDYQGRSAKDPDFTPLTADFEILDQRRSSQVRMVDGQVHSSTSWRLLLAPRRTGTLHIPPLELDGARSATLAVAVAPAAAAGDAGRPVFATAEVDRRDAVPGEQILFTLRLHTRVALRNLAMDDFTVADAEVRRLTDHHYRKTIDGHSFEVVELRYALLPQQPGRLEIPAVHFAAREGGGGATFGHPFGSAGRTLRVASPELEITIAPRPAGAGADWLPAHQVTLEQDWSNAGAALRVGEPVTRTLTITAHGSTAARIPPLELPETGHYRRYAEQPELHDSAGDLGLTGQRSERYALVAEHPGTLVLPALQLRWWNTEAGRFEVARIPEQHLSVLPAAAGGPAPTAPAAAPVAAPPAAAGGTKLIYGLALGNALSLAAALLFAILWWRRASPRTPQVATADLTADLGAVARAANARDWPVLHDALLAWARSHWRDPGIVSLAQVAARADSARLREAFHALAAACYAPGGGPGPDPGVLLGELRALAASRPRAQPGDALPPLYPAVPPHP